MQGQCLEHHNNNEYFCVNQNCENNCVLLCDLCLNINQHQACQKLKQAIHLDQYTNKIGTQLDERIRKEQVLLENLNKTKNDLIQFDEDIRQNINQSRIDSIMMKQNAILLKELRVPALLKKIKKNNQFSYNYFSENIEVQRQSPFIANLIENFNQSLKEMKNKFAQKIQKEQISFQENNNTLPNNQINNNYEQNTNLKIKMKLSKEDQKSNKFIELRQFANEQQIIKSNQQNQSKIDQQLKKRISQNPIEGILLKSQNELIIYSDKTVYQFDLQDQKKPIQVYDTQYPIINLLIDDTKKILIHMEKQILIVNDKLKYLDEIQKKIFQNHITIHSYCKIYSNLIYYNKDENKLVKCQIVNKIALHSSTKLQLSGLNLLSIKLIKCEIKDEGQFFLLAFSSGLIQKYELNSMDKINEYQLCKTECSQISLENDYCYGISEKNLYFMKYSNGVTQKICTSQSDIIQCACFINEQSNLQKILVLQQDNKLFKYSTKGDKIKQRQAKIKDVTSLLGYIESNQPNNQNQKKQSKCYLGFKDGQIMGFNID
ncbi:unnamed protein product [Paramecium sonneborni]|uniref:Uncharacterized protein n=1 Tax=Paramecium sonneborni TaxID=65129 RepID=A0A8S1QX37_9CILI|nr:unnamed protein product [Paramecium sonneborni]